MRQDGDRTAAGPALQRQRPLIRGARERPGRAAGTEAAAQGAVQSPVVARDRRYEQEEKSGRGWQLASPLGSARLSRAGPCCAARGGFRLPATQQMT